MKNDLSRGSQRKRSVFLPLVPVVFIVLIGTGFWAGTAHADEPGYLISIQFENDFFGGGTDRHFSHGTRPARSSGSPMQRTSSLGSNPKERGAARKTSSRRGPVYRSGRTSTPPRIPLQLSSSPRTGPMRDGSTWDSDWSPTRAPNVSVSRH